MSEVSVGLSSAASTSSFQSAESLVRWTVEELVNCKVLGRYFLGTCPLN